MYELPPILTGTEAQQIAALRDYLVRIARQENGETAAAGTTAASLAARGQDGQSAAATPTAATDVGLADMRATAGRLRALIVKNTQGLGQLEDQVERLDGRGSHLHIKYSDDGRTFTENQGETLGAWIGIYVDYDSADSDNFDDYTWRRFADDRELKSLVDYVEEHCQRIEQTLRQDYLAVSDFGVYREEISAAFETTAKRIVESYDYLAEIQAVNDRLGGVDSYLTQMSGQIRRGLITDPETGEEAMGIAISEHLSFTGQVRQEGGAQYYELSPGSTLGLYTATGWQFWINGSKRGWFDSTDGMLHVTNLAADNSLQLGGAWLLTAADGLGIRVLN